jgi:hypothetical protein
MIRHQTTFENLALLLPRQGMKDVFQLAACLSKQGFSSLLWDKHHMVFAIPFRMG